MDGDGVRIDRLERYTHFLQNITLSLGALVVTALAYDRVQANVELGASTVELFLAAVACFLVSGLCGGHVAAQLAVMDETFASDLESRRTTLIRIGRSGLVTLKLGHWRSLQHWALVLAIAFGCSGGLVVVDNKDLAAKHSSSATSSRNGT